MSAGVASAELRVPLTPPFASGPLLAALRSHTVPGLERHDAATGTHTRAIRTRHGAATVSVTLRDTDHVTVRIAGTAPRDTAEVVETVRHWLDLDTDPAIVDAAFADDPRLGPLTVATPGLRVLGSTDWFSTAVQTVLGQQVSVAAACTFGGRLVAEYGDDAPGGLRCFPTPQRLAGADPERLRAVIGTTRSRARTVQALAAAAGEGLDPATASFRADLLALPGIGPWTVEYLALRVLGDRDAYPSGDLVLRRALGVDTTREVLERAQSWRPWRAYAVSHLWTVAAYSPSVSSA
ncbi:DNA-3-methyladenine glycosylase family protein [Rhodococcus chondri]|uniref:DNA-3-methyladenine glycosylase II n=1 Tax=Rhodococcus chondri TaxID=3065941 RepID=A0ABU7JPX7_9NOCA|nr:AlkA N-terminal domain-containing protein [Rhodococcus sp. CC-R104]MEE2032089.1 AlkA N-terminal domain-containing protein [Rhodococcus sp. CC-R104]